MAGASGSHADSEQQTMIVVADGGELLLVTQPDHARFAAELLRLWRRSELPRHPRREALIAAVREHDNGWREADAAPRLEPSTGQPHDFRSLPGEHRREIWRRGVERFAESEPYTALLAAEHSWRIHQARRAETRWGGFLDELAERRAELLEAAGITAAELAADYRWLALADDLSLVACCRREAPVAGHGLEARWSDGELELDPFPLAGATTFQIPCRRIPDRRYGGEADLASALGAARWIRLPVRCRPVR